MEVAQAAVNIMHSSYPTQCFRIVLWSRCVAGNVGCCWYDVRHGSIETRDCLLCSERMFVCGWQGVKAGRRIGMLLLCMIHIPLFSLAAGMSRCIEYTPCINVINT